MKESNNPEGIDTLRSDKSLRTIGLVVTDVLGEGGTAIVYRARDARHERNVAVKVLRTSAPASAARRFAQEVLVAGRLRHAHMLPLFDSGRLEDGRLFSVMPVAEGRPLSELIKEGPMPITDAVRIAREVAEAIGYMHRNGFVHRDVKPENILVESGHAVLTDFGLAIAHGAREEADGTTHSKSDSKRVGGDRFTQSGKIVGTLPYMSPEALMANASADSGRDIYAVGVVLYEMLAGALPFKSNSPVRIMANRLRSGVPSIRSVRADVPQEIDDVIVGCTSADASKRFKTADEIVAALSLPAAGEISKRQRLMTFAGLLLVALTLGAVLFNSASGGGSDGKLDPGRVVVADLANDTGDPSLSHIGALAGDIIVSSLADDDKLTVVNASIALPSRLQRRLPPADSTLARMTQTLVSSSRAGLVVTGAYFRVGTGLEFMAQLTNTETGRVLGTVGPLDAPVSRPDSALRTLGNRIVAILNTRK